MPTRSLAVWARRMYRCGGPVLTPDGTWIWAASVTPQIGAAGQVQGAGGRVGEPSRVTSGVLSTSTPARIRRLSAVFREVHYFKWSEDGELADVHACWRTATDVCGVIMGGGS